VRTEHGVHGDYRTNSHPVVDTQSSPFFTLPPGGSSLSEGRGSEDDGLRTEHGVHGDYRTNSRPVVDTQFTLPPGGSSLSEGRGSKDDGVRTEHGVHGDYRPRESSRLTTCPGYVTNSETATCLVADSRRSRGRQRTSLYNGRKQAQDAYDTFYIRRP